MVYHGYEEGLVERVQSSNNEELERVITNNENSIENQTKILSSLEPIKDQPTISEKEYYARAIFDLYNWEQQRITFTNAQKEKLIKKLQEKQVEKIYENLIESGVSEERIPTIVLNLITLNRNDTEQVINEIEQGNITKDIFEQFKDQDEKFMKPVKPEQLEDYLEFYKVEGTDIKLRDYQQNAIDKVDKIFESHRFASVILPTGAGKSFVAIAELMKMQAQIGKGSNEKILYLAPSNEILNQIMKYTEKYVHGEKLGKTREQIFKEIFPNVELTTYQSLLQKSEEELQNQKYKFMVLDELHRTGAKEWGDRLNTVLEAQNENVRVLGITATPERDVDGRNMADEVALKLGFTEEEIANRKHIAKKMDLIDAIRLGIVVNPKVVECEYNLKNDTQRWEALLEKINGMEDGPEKEEYIHKYQELRRKLNEAQEIPELLRDNIVKKDGKYIFYMPIGANEYNEDDEGNTVSKKSGADKVAQAQQQLQEWLKYIDAEPEFYSMLGEYKDKRNAEQLERFENSNSKHIKIMIVMNKLNEGVHVDGINGIIWQRALDENSRILLLQQLGRAIYSTNEGELINDENRPIVIDLPNNLTRVDLEKVLNTYTEIDDIEMLQNVLDWIDVHAGILPDINSGFKEEARMASTLKRIQGKYIKYMDDEEFKKISEDKVTKVETILEMGNDISLWDLELPDREKKIAIDKVKKCQIEEVEFSLSGISKDFVMFEQEADKKNPIYIKTIRLIRKWMEDNNSKNPPRSQNNTKTVPEEEAILGGRLSNIRQGIIKEYNSLNTENEKEEFKKAHPGFEEVLEFMEEIKKESIFLKKAKKIKEWMEQNNITVPPANRKGNSKTEREYAKVLVQIKRDFVTPYDKLETEQEKTLFKENIPDFDVAYAIVKNILENDVTPYLKDAQIVKDWVNKHDGKIPQHMSRKELNEEEYEVGKKLRNIKNFLLTPYEALETEEEREEFKKRNIGVEKVIEIINEIDSNRTSPYYRNAKLIKEWMQRNNTTKPPRSQNRTKTVPKEEVTLGNALSAIRQEFINVYNLLQTEKEKGEFRKKHPDIEKTIEIIDYIDRNNIPKPLENIRTIKKWMQESNTKRPPRNKKSDFVSDEELDLGVRYGNLKKKIKKIKGEEERNRYKKTTKLTEAQLIEIEKTIEEIESGRVMTQKIGQATYSTSAPKCDEASVVIKELLLEKEKIANK